MSETCRVSCQNKFLKLLHLVGFITKKFVTMHGHANAIYLLYFQFLSRLLESNDPSCVEILGIGIRTNFLSLKARLNQDR